MEKGHHTNSAEGTCKTTTRKSSTPVCFRPHSAKLERATRTQKACAISNCNPHKIMSLLVHPMHTRSALHPSTGNPSSQASSSRPSLCESPLSATLQIAKPRALGFVAEILTVEVLRNLQAAPFCDQAWLDLKAELRNLQHHWVVRIRLAIQDIQASFVSCHCKQRPARNK